MNTHRVWVEIVILGTAAACVLALLLATVGAAAGAAAGGEVGSGPVPARQQTYHGMVTCFRCGGKHSATIGRTTQGCILACVKGGDAFALIDGDQTYLLDGDLVVLKKVAGQRASVVGAIKGNTIKVSSVAAQIG